MASSHQTPHDAAPISRGGHALCSVSVYLQRVHCPAVLRQRRHHRLHWNKWWCKRVPMGVQVWVQVSVFVSEEYCMYAHQYGLKVHVNRQIKERYPIPYFFNHVERY